jgi:hypothetical protein
VVDQRSIRIRKDTLLAFTLKRLEEDHRVGSWRHRILFSKKAQEQGKAIPLNRAALVTKQLPLGLTRKEEAMLWFEYKHAK